MGTHRNTMHALLYIPSPPPQGVEGVEGSGKLDPKRADGQVSSSLVALFKSSSPHFSTTIRNQVRGEGGGEKT